MTHYNLNSLQCLWTSTPPTPCVSVIKVVMLSSVTDLLRYIDENQLTSEFGGTLDYCHSDWIVLRTVKDDGIDTLLNTRQYLVKQDSLFARYRPLRVLRLWLKTLLRCCRRSVRSWPRHIYRRSAVLSSSSCCHTPRNTGDLRYGLIVFCIRLNMVSTLTKFIPLAFAKENIKNIWCTKPSGVNYN